MNRFWENVNKTNTCWLWIGHITNKGIGIFWTGKRKVSARKFAYQLIKGKTPYMPLRITCGNRLCVNPKHVIDRYCK